MKSIIIITNHMKIGGIQKSLLELLKALSQRNDFKVSLFCCNAVGEYLPRIPKEIAIVPENIYAKIAEESLEICKKQGIWYYLLRAFLSLWSKMFGKSIPAYILCKLINVIDGSYDIAISYSQPIEDHKFCSLTNEIALNCCRAKEYISFIHCDFASYGGNTRYNKNLLSKFDRIAAVSDSVGFKFCRSSKISKEKVFTVRNFFDSNEIFKLANTDPIKYEKTAIITVARLSEEKGLLRCVLIIANLKAEGLCFEWHIVGGGSLENKLRLEISRYGLSDTIFLEGEQQNPYRFMKNADYFFLPSFHEAAPMVFDEAAVLGVPILATETTSAKEMVQNEKNGYICENSDQGIYKLLKDVLTKKLKCRINTLPDKTICMKQFEDICCFDKEDITV